MAMDRITSMSQNLHDLIMGMNPLLYPDAEIKKHAQKAMGKDMTTNLRMR
jgi:hypothetical protein